MALHLVVHGLVSQIAVVEDEGLSHQIQGRVVQVFRLECSLVDGHKTTVAAAYNMLFDSALISASQSRASSSSQKSSVLIECFFLACWYTRSSALGCNETDRYCG